MGKTTRIKKNSNNRKSIKTTEKLHKKVKLRKEREEQEEIEPIDKDENLVISKNLEITEDDLSLFKKLESSYKPEPAKKNTSIHNLIKNQEKRDLLSNPAQDPKIKAVYEK